jgi:hypothetical protein
METAFRQRFCGLKEGLAQPKDTDVQSEASLTVDLKIAATFVLPVT